MRIIITEKAIAGKRIAGILAGKQVSTLYAEGAQYFEYERNGEKERIIPLRGHIVDIEFPKEYSNWMGTDLKKLIDAEIKYQGKDRKITNFLKKSGQEANEVIIATDADREGESIGREVLKYILEGNSKIKIKRAYFSAIIKKDIEEAFQNLQELDYNLADSADTRREIDLVWGAVLTRFLSIASGKMGKEFLSVGRVQSPTLAIIVKRELERKKFVPQKFWEIKALFEKEKDQFEGMHKEGRFWEEEKAQKIMQKKESPCVIKEVTKRKRIIKKPIPFNTTEYLRSATAIGYSAGKAMSLAESLYQNGYTSYPRTDNSTYPKNLDLREILKELREVSEFKKIADELLKKEKLEPSAGKETKDHPPIHPVSKVQKSQLGKDEWKIYELITRRFFATLGDEAETENITAEIMMKDEPFLVHGQTFIKKGWKEYYPYSKTVEVILPELKKGDLVDLLKLDLEAKETQAPPRYSQSSLIKLMEELGLGTKSTRAAIIQKLYDRKYIFGKKAIEPNIISFAVIESLEKYSKKVTEAKMTADLEKIMDEIASGKEQKDKTVNVSREQLTQILEELIGNKEKIGVELKSALKQDEVLGDCNKENCPGKLIIRKGKTGKRFAACNQYPNCVNSFPLPQKGKIQILSTKCEKCGTPEIQIQGTKYKFKMCLDPNCETKKDWGQKSKTNTTKKTETK